MTTARASRVRTGRATSRPPRLVTFAVAACACLLACSRGALDRSGVRGESRVPSAAREAVREVVDGLVTALETKDLARIRAAYGPDSTRWHAVRGRYEAFLGLDSVRCRERSSVIGMHGDTAEAIVSELVTWREHGRTRADGGWRTLEFVESAGRWQLVADRERRAMQARYTDLAITLEPSAGTMSGTARLVVDVVAPGADELVLGLNRGLLVEAVRGGAGEALPFERVADALTIRLDRPGAPGDSILATIAFRGSLFNERREQGYSQVSIGPKGSFASWVTSWYPHVAGVGSKSRGRITYDVPSGVTVASSGRAVSAADEAGRSRQAYEVEAPLDFSFAAAPYFHRSEIVAGIDVGVYFLEGGDAKAELYIRRCAEIIEFLRGIYGSYPFDGYAVVELPAESVGTLGGSSEQGMNLFPTGGLPDTAFPLALLGHEIGHSWWGNLVSGSSALIDEGLAQTTALLCVEALAGPEEMRRFLRHGLPGYGQSADLYFHRFAGAPSDLPLATLPNAADQVMALHDLADTKGFFVFEMLRELIGDDVWRKGLRTAVARFAHRRIEIGDLRAIWEAESRLSLGWFFDQWFQRTGAPEFRMRYAVHEQAEGFAVEGTVEQTGDPYRVSAEIVLAAKGRPPRTERIELSGPSASFLFHAAERPDTVLFDPGYKIFRWTDAHRMRARLVEAREQRAAGRADSARAALDGYLATVSDNASGLCELGGWMLEDGDLAGAARAFRTVVDRAAVYDDGDPATGRAALGLGKLADLDGGRAEAQGWYERVVERAGEEPIGAEARELLQTPFTRPAPLASAPDAQLLARCAGKYGTGSGLTVTIEVRTLGLLAANTSMGQSFALRRLEGARFRSVEREDVTFVFRGDGERFAELEITSGARTFTLTRIAQ